ncbi:transposase [Vreelandella alkaliphila]
MKWRFSNEHIINILKAIEAGSKVKELCQKYDISYATF